jgi:methanogenic corrinoid protein MtbC1
VALDHVAMLVARGMSTEMLLLNFIAPAAKLLGEHWDTDFKTFTEVTTGLGTLQRIVQAVGSSYAPKTGHRGLVVLTAAQGEQHTLGLFLLGEFLQRNGWGVDLVPGLNTEQVCDLVAGSHVEMVGITVSSQKLLGPLGRMIATLRRQSLNPNLRIVVGGSIDLSEFTREHQLPLLCGPQDAVRWLEERVAGAKGVAAS